MANVFHLTSRKITMQVISSITLSSFLHLLKEALTKFSAAPSAFFYKKYGYTILATSIFSKNSHTPSLAITTTLSSFVN
jgi:hypothetical protein